MRINPKLIEEGYVSVQKHPECDYYIYNYTHKAQFSQNWDDDTRKCRGLILDGHGNVIARPFPKFHNWEEYGKGSKLGELPPYKSFEMFEKLDGSLGILYKLPSGKFAIATRGSFVSDQAKFATQYLNDNFAEVKFQSQYTYLFEIIYPENRIVLDYGDRKEIVLLAMIDNHNGKDLKYDTVMTCAVWNNIPIAHKYDGFKDFSEIKNLNVPNQEGFVILFDNGLRIKIKFEDYVKVHKMVFNLSTKSIWECLRGGQSIETHMEGLPDEFFQWAREEKEKLMAQFMEIEVYCNRIIGSLGYLRKTEMKDIALFFKACKYQAVLFAMYKEKPYKDIIWKLLEPKYRQPFKEE